jgi:hypothetical protein
MKKLMLSLAAVLAIGAGLAPAAVRTEQPAGEARPGSLASEYRPILEKHAAAVVTIKYEAKMGGQSQEQEIPGVVIDSKGLVLCSNVLMGGLLRKYDPSVEFAEIKILTADDQEGVDAKIIARDSDLDLAWVQVKEPKAEYVFLDFGKAVEPEAGDQLLSLVRLGKFFDRAPVITVGHMAGTAKKPRRLFVGEAEIPGTVVFAHGGALVGMSVLPTPSDEEMEGDAFQSAMRDPFAQRVILPASEIVTATAKAREAAASGKGEEEAKPAPAGPDAPDAPKEGEPKKDAGGGGGGGK